MALSVHVIEGLVQDARGQPVAGARISWAAAPVPVPDLALLTNAQGRFALSAPAPGHYRLRADSDSQGFVEHSLQVSGKALRLILTLPG